MKSAHKYTGIDMKCSVLAKALPNISGLFDLVADRVERVNCGIIPLLFCERIRLIRKEKADERQVVFVARFDPPQKDPTANQLMQGLP